MFIKSEKKDFTLQDLKRKRIISDDTPVSEAERLLELANDPRTYLAFDIMINIRKETAENFVEFILYGEEKPKEIPESVWNAMECIAIQMRLKADKDTRKMFSDSWGPW